MAVLRLVIALMCVIVINGQTLKDLEDAKKKVEELERSLREDADIEQPIISVQDKNLNIRLPRDASMTLTRRQTVDVTDLETRVDTLESNAEILAYKATMNATSGMMSQVVGSLVTMQNTQTDFEKTLEEKLDDSFSTMQTTMLGLSDAVKSNMTLYSQNLDQQFATTKQALLKSVDKEIDAINKSTTASISGMMQQIATLSQSVATLTKDLTSSAETAIFIGGTRNSLTTSGWFEFPVNREELNAGGSMFVKEGSRFKALKAGFFRLEYGGIMHGGWCHNHLEIWIDNFRIRDSTHEYVPGTWQNVAVEASYYMKAGQKMWLRYYRGCGYAAHGSTSYNAHNRLTFRFLGTKGAKCTGQYCNGL
eukprot:m.94691 g.94691  ORF g.94691 m.94691 type:complete len:365 (+) comp26747_c0_seq1:59-1153(+)